MSKEDIGDAPVQVPKKRRQLEQAPDLWIAQWLSRDVTPSERKRLEAVKQERKKSVRDVRVGVLVGREGVTPEQLDKLVEVVRSLRPTEIHQTRLPSRVHQALKMPVMRFLYERPIGNFQEIIKASTAVVICPRSSDGPLWEQEKYARHRGVAVRVIMPNGEEQ